MLPNQNFNKLSAGTHFKNRYVLQFSAIVLLGIITYTPALAQQDTMMIRIAEIELNPAYIEDYMVILKEELAASVKLEPGVMVIFPMYQKENPAVFRLLEIYASREAYEHHLQTPHFQKYKTTTRNMVKSLKLIPMEAIDPETMTLLFTKMEKEQ